MVDFIYILTFAVNFCLCGVAFALARSAIAAGSDPKPIIKRFTWAAVLIGFIAGLPLLSALFWLLEGIGHRVNLGHGEGLIATVAFNFIFGLLLAGIGRMLLGWCRIDW